ncbi:TonB family protein [Mucilaginibacter sp.]|uniref:energy transducer TonB n=1 Tax=Mucilaginibacter sp. TaxID=1882438 RepID=UPI003D103430
MYKKILFTLLGLSLFTAASAQSGGLIYYLNNSGKLVSKDSADYSVAVFPPDSSVDKNLFVVYEYYQNGKPKLITGSKTNGANLRYQGHYIAYFPNGHKKAMGSFDNGKQVGHETRYFPNNKFNLSKDYLPDGKIRYGDCRDSTGKVLVENGSGNWLELDDDLTNIQAEGKLTAGKQEGLWHIKKNDTTNIENEYKNGELKISEYKYKSGNSFFALVDVLPEFPGGLKGFSAFLARSIRYPAVAREYGTQGRVIISFYCESNGTITHVSVARGIGDGCDEEAQRVVKLSPEWKPGYVHGKPVRVAFSVPIAFSLTDNHPQKEI